jgi:cytochrome oxidase Cu insertion factor (SCO1/SenC/PrrC family)
MPSCLVRLSRAALLVLAGVVLAAPSRSPRDVPPDEDRFINEPLPDIELTTASNAHVMLSSVARGRPLLFTFVFTRCAGVCSPFLASWRAADRSVSSSQTFRRLVLSFDQRDTAADMGAFARHLGADGDPDWTFAIASPPDVQRLADATGFWFDWDESRQQFDHPALIAAARAGRLVRLLVGGVVSQRRLDGLMREAFGEFVPSYPLPSGVRFRCVQFDVSTGRLTLDWGFLVLLLPVVVSGLLTAVMFVAGSRGRSRTTGSDQLEARHV